MFAQEKMKVNIAFDFVDGPFGGANQFLKSLRRQIRLSGQYVESALEADVVLVNCSPASFTKTVPGILKLKREKPSLYVVARIDGPVQLIRGTGKEYDQAFFAFDRKACDGSIFQSNWSHQRCVEGGLTPSKSHNTIINAADSSKFFKAENSPSKTSSRTRIIITSWSANKSKGFDTYQWLDSNLNFDEYSVTMIGNSNINFKNIEFVAPMPSEELAQQIREHDIYLTASKNDPCSNALVEALSCGIPAIAFADGGHPEIVRNGGECYQSHDELLEKLNLVRSRYDIYLKQITVPSDVEVAQKYMAFFSQLSQNPPKQLSWAAANSLKLQILRTKIKSAINSRRSS